MEKKRNVISYQKPDEKALFEESFQFWYQGELKEKREKAGKWVQKKLENVFCERNEIPPKTYAAFLRGTPGAYGKLRPILLAYLDYPKEKLSPLEKHEKPGKPAAKAPAWLTKEMGKKLSSEGGISSATWSRFTSGSYAPSQETLRKIDGIAGLTLAESQTLRKMVPRDVIEDVSRISPEVLRQWEEWKETLLEEEDIDIDRDSLFVFRTYTGVSEKAMKVFFPREEQNSGPRPTSQGTLLKLTVAFRLDPQSGESFLALADSGFYTMRDAVFYTCLVLKKFDIPVVNAYLDDYAYNPRSPDKPRFENPYRTEDRED